MSHYTSGIGISYKFSYKDSLYGENPGVLYKDLIMDYTETL